MAGKSATLAIRIVSDAKGASAGFDAAESRVAGFQRGLDKASIAAGGVLTGVGALAKGAFDAASALQQSTGAIDSVFGDWALDIEQAAQGAAQTVGLATAPYENAASLIGSQLKNMGFSVDENVAKTQELIATGSDLASTFGGTTEEAVAALSSALKGERDPIERYGVALSQAAIDSKVAALGLDTSTDASKRAAQAQATLALISEQTASSQGAFAREADTAAGAQARAAAEWENAQAALGEVLLPLVTEAATKFAGLTQDLVANKDVVIPLIGVLGGLAAGIIALNAGMRAYAVVQGIVNAVMNASPLMRLVMIITGIIAVVILLVNHFGGFQAVADKVGNALKWAFDKAKAGIQWVVDKIGWLLKHTPAGLLAGAVSSMFGGPATLAVQPRLVGGVPAMAGVYGAAATGLAPAPMYGAPMTALSGGGGSASAGQGATNVTNVNVTVQGALDPVAVGRQLVKVLREYGVATGGQVSLTIGGRP